VIERVASIFTDNDISTGSIIASGVLALLGIVGLATVVHRENRKEHGYVEDQEGAFEGAQENDI
jgi:hypothetical protein